MKERVDYYYYYYYYYYYCCCCCCYHYYYANWPIFPVDYSNSGRVLFVPDVFPGFFFFFGGGLLVRNILQIKRPFCHPTSDVNALKE